MSTFKERKKERRKNYLLYEYGWKLEECGACSGSGYYDHNGSPPCGLCEGTGKTRYQSCKSIQMVVKVAERLVKIEQDRQDHRQDTLKFHRRLVRKALSDAARAEDRLFTAKENCEKQLKIIESFSSKLGDNMKDPDPHISKIIDKYFWELI